MVTQTHSSFPLSIDLWTYIIIYNWILCCELRISFSLRSSLRFATMALRHTRSVVEDSVQVESWTSLDIRKGTSKAARYLTHGFTVRTPWRIYAPVHQAFVFTRLRVGRVVIVIWGRAEAFRNPGKYLAEGRRRSHVLFRGLAAP